MKTFLGGAALILALCAANAIGAAVFAIFGPKLPNEPFLWFVLSLLAIASALLFLRGVYQVVKR